MLVEDGKLKMRKNLYKQNTPAISTEIETRGGALSVVFLDLTWTELDFWDQVWVSDFMI